MVSKESLLVEPSACPKKVRLNRDSGKIPESWLASSAIGIAYKSEFKSFVFELVCLIYREKDGSLELVFWIITSGQSRAIGTVGEEGLGYGGVRRFRYTVVKKWLKRRIGTPRIKLENSLMPIWLLDLSSPIPGMVPANWAIQS